MTPQTDDPRITAYIFDELPAVEREAFEIELRDSAELRAAVAQTRHTLELLSNGLAGEDTPGLTPEQRAALATKMNAPVAAGSRGNGWTKFGIPLATAALVMLSVGVYFAWRATQDQMTSTTLALQTNKRAARQVETRSADEPAESLLTDLEVQEPGERDESFRQAEATFTQKSERDSLQALVGPTAASASPPTSTPTPRTNSELAPGPVSGDWKGTKKFNDPGPAPLGMSRDGRKMDQPPVADPYGEYGGEMADHGHGPGQGGDRYALIQDNPFLTVAQNPLSTFSIDVDTAAYSKVRMYLLEHGQLPRPDAVRIEELVNYFTYDYEPPRDESPFSANMEVAECPWAPEHRLLRVGLKGREVQYDQRPPTNLVFLLDVSGSMNQPNKLPLLKQGMKMLVDQLSENDRVAMVVYAGAAGLVLESTTGDEKAEIMEALDHLHAGGSTNGGQGIALAYQTALENFIAGGVNRVILCTDGDFNVGVTGTDELVRLAESNAKTGVFLSVLGFGMGNHNDAMLEQISNKGNGNYAFIDTEREARKVLVEQMSGTLVTIAKDVKIQIEFNPARVAAYRLIGYENRLLAAEDFNDDTKDAGEIGAGHTVTALYELVPAGTDSPPSIPAVDPLKYQQPPSAAPQADSEELLTLKLRYKQPDEDKSTKLEFPVSDSGRRFGAASADFRFAASVAAFGMLLRDSPHKGNATYAAVAEIATASADNDASGYRAEFLKLVEQARQITGG